MKIPFRLIAASALGVLASTTHGIETGFAGVYFGTFKDTPGEWAMVSDGENLPTFIGFLPNHRTNFENYPYGGDFYPDGRFEDYASRYTFDGQIAGGSVQGFLSGTSAISSRGFAAEFYGAKDSGAGGPGWRIEGSYALRGASLSPRFQVPWERARVIVGPGGKFVITAEAYSDEIDIYVSDWPREWQAGASGHLDSSGRGHFTSAEGMKGEIVIEQSGRVHAIVTPPGSDSPIHLEGLYDRLVNLSTRGRVGRGENVLISGFVIAGSGNKRMLLRAIGPSLVDFDVPNGLANPRIDLTRMSDRVTIASSDNWGDSGNGPDLAEAMERAGAFPISQGSRDAALLVDLPAGAYTAVVSGVGGGQGIALTEVYAVDDDLNRGAQLTNISTRGFVGTGGELLIPGFTLTGNKHGYLLIRAVGPSLADHGVSNPLPDPVLTVYNQSTGKVVATNDDWDSYGNTLDGTFRGIGAFPLRRGSHDAALYFLPAPNTGYTVVVSSKDGSTGVALAEIYNLERPR